MKQQNSHSVLYATFESLMVCFLGWFWVHYHFYGLFNDGVTNSDYIGRMMGLVKNELGRKRLWPNLRYRLVNGLERLRKSRKSSIMIASLRSYDRILDESVSYFLQFYVKKLSLLTS
jgi:hypothetical protein